MKITKPQANQILFEDDNFKKFDLEVKSKAGLNSTEYNETYNGFILAYRQPNMDASKQIFYGNDISICSLLCSCLKKMLIYRIIDEDALDEITKSVKEEFKKKREAKSSEWGRKKYNS